MDCHVRQGQSRFVEGNRWDSQVAEFGIACEACHSEGRQHIEANRNPIRRFTLHLTTKTDSTITNPSRLKGADSALDCGQCHSVWAFNNMPDKIDFNRHGSGFRPGAHDLVRSEERRVGKEWRAVRGKELLKINEYVTRGRRESRHSI